MDAKAAGCWSALPRCSFCHEPGGDKHADTLLHAAFIISIFTIVGVLVELLALPLFLALTTLLMNADAPWLGIHLLRLAFFLSAAGRCAFLGVMDRDQGSMPGHIAHAAPLPFPPQDALFAEVI